jgi:predicted nucleic acid-binding protein
VLLLDNSAWARLASPRLPPDVAEMVADWLTEQQLATSLPFLLEAGYSARSGSERRGMMFDLMLLPRIELDRDIEKAALRAQADLAEVGQHRLPPSDLVIAACADAAGMGVLHYDKDFDLIARHTSLSFDSRWLAPAGVL